MVAKAAPPITEHPQPPLAEKVRIQSFAGTDAGKFKGYHKETHQAARNPFKEHFYGQY